MIVVLIFGVMTALPVFAAMGLLCLAHHIETGSELTQLILNEPMFHGLRSFAFLAVPVFVLSGKIMACGKLIDKLLDVACVFVGHFRCGLAQVNMLSGVFSAGICGFNHAEIAAMSRHGRCGGMSAAGVPPSGQPVAGCLGPEGAIRSDLCSECDRCIVRAVCCALCLCHVRLGPDQPIKLFLGGLCPDGDADRWCVDHPSGCGLGRALCDLAEYRCNPPHAPLGGQRSDG